MTRGNAACVSTRLRARQQKLQQKLLRTARTAALEAKILPTYGGGWRSERYLDDPDNNSRVHRIRKSLWFIELWKLTRGRKRPKQWTRSRQRALVERAREVNALPRRTLSAALESASPHRFKRACKVKHRRGWCTVYLRPW